MSPLCSLSTVAKEAAAAFTCCVLTNHWHHQANSLTWPGMPSHINKWVGNRALHYCQNMAAWLNLGNDVLPPPCYYFYTILVINSTDFGSNWFQWTLGLPSKLLWHSLNPAWLEPRAVWLTIRVSLNLVWTQFGRIGGKLSYDCISTSPINSARGSPCPAFVQTQRGMVACLWCHWTNMATGSANHGSSLLKICTIM